MCRGGKTALPMLASKAPPRRAALKAPPSRRAEGATTARRLERHTVPRLGCHRYAVLKAPPMPRRSSPLPRLLAQAFGGHQRRAACRAPPRTTYQWQRTTTTEYVQHRSYYRPPRIKESSIKVSRVMVFMHYHLTALQCTEVRFASFLSSGFTTMAVMNPLERKLVKRTSVQWLEFTVGVLWYVQSCAK